MPNIIQKILLIASITIFACNKIDKEKRPKEANIKCSHFYAQGEYKTDTYTFCGSTPIEISYYYKVGKWKYWNFNGQLIAKGSYKPIKIKITDKGGCPYEIIESKINEGNWNFWDEKGNKIKPNNNLIAKLEYCPENVNH